MLLKARVSITSFGQDVNGDILVVATTSESTDGMFGELLAVSSRALVTLYSGPR